MRIRVLLAVLAFLFAVPASAHSGGTDSQGGHHDYKNVSGLGSYHYHHLPNVCEDGDGSQECRECLKMAVEKHLQAIQD